MKFLNVGLPQSRLLGNQNKSKNYMRILELIVLITYIILRYYLRPIPEIM